MLCRRTVVIVLYLSISDIIDSYRVDLVPERPAITYMNEKYIESARFYLTRYGRKSAYYANIEAYIKYPWGNNVTVHIVFYERLSNEYKRSFVEFKKRLCDLVRFDLYLGKLLRDTRFECPTTHIRLMNMTLLNIPMPYKWPFTKAKVEATLANLANETIAVGHTYMTIRMKN